VDCADSGQDSLALGPSKESPRAPEVEKAVLKAVLAMLTVAKVVAAKTVAVLKAVLAMLTVTKVVAAKTVAEKTLTIPLFATKAQQNQK